MPRPPYREELGDKPNEGARLLRVALTGTKESYAAAGHRLGVSSGLVSRWVFCDGKPGRAVADRLRDIYGIDPTAWDKAPTEPIQLAARTGTEG